MKIAMLLSSQNIIRDVLSAVVFRRAHLINSSERSTFGSNHSGNSSNNVGERLICIGSNSKILISILSKSVVNVVDD